MGNKIMFDSEGKLTTGEERKVLVDHILTSVLENAALNAKSRERLQTISDRWRTNNLMGLHDYEWIERLYEEYC